MYWCCYLYYTTCGEKIYIKRVTKPSKIKGLRHLSNVNLKRLADKEQIERLQKGIYYKEKETVFGKTKPNIDAVMTQVLTVKKDERIGYETGASFLNQIGLTTLMPRIPI